MALVPIAARPERTRTVLRVRPRHVMWGLSMCLLLLPPSARTQEEIIRYHTEANYLAHFASFVEWPASAFADSHAPILLCTSGGVDFGNALQELTRGMVVRGRSIEVRSVKTMPQSRLCHILFIGRNDAGRYRKIFDSLRDSPVLTVGETADFLAAGGAVNFVFGETLQFEVNLSVTNHAHLKLRSTLLVMAKRVIGASETKSP